MQVKQHEIDSVEAKLHGQNGLLAAVAVAIWSAPLLAFWYWIYQLNSLFAPLMLAISGAIVGIAVRLHGRGYTSPFGAIAFIAHAVVVFAALVLGVILGEGQTVRAFILVGFYALGAWLALYLGKIGVPFEQHKAFFLLTEQTNHPSSKLFRNRWIVVAPLTFILCSFVLFISLIILGTVNELETEASQLSKEKQRHENLQNRAIDVSDTHLELLSNDEAMRHAFAFFKGNLPTRNGYSYSAYPKSEYKTKRILSFLVENREYTRAKFVLGLLTYNENGILLIQDAADEGDIYAKIHIATQFGCNGDTERAKELLNLLAKTTDEKSAKNEIYSILTVNFKRICAEFKKPEFSHMYIRE